MTQLAEHGTVLGCFEGTVSEPVRRILASVWGTVALEAITVPAPDRLLAECSDLGAVARLHAQVRDSLRTQTRPQVAVVSHSGGGPDTKTDDRRIEWLRTAVEHLKREHPLAAVVGIWVSGTGVPLRIEF
jgi:hypothetical protein